MKRAKVKSSNVKSVGYDEDTEILEVEFFNKAVYQYFDVPKKLHLEMMKAKSVGKYLNYKIKDNFRSEKVA